MTQFEEQVEQVTQAMVEAAALKTDAYLVQQQGSNDTWFAYHATDCVWFAHITREEIAKLIAKAKG